MGQGTQYWELLLGCLVLRTLHSHCSGSGFHPCSGLRSHKLHGVPPFFKEEIHVIKISILPKFFYRCNTSQAENSMRFLVKTDKLILKYTWKCKGQRIIKIIWKRRGLRIHTILQPKRGNKKCVVSVPRETKNIHLLRVK